MKKILLSFLILLCINTDGHATFVDQHLSELCAAWDSTTTVVAQTVDMPAPWSGTITGLWGKTGGTGTPSFTAGLQIGGVNVTSCNAVSISSGSNASTTCTAANTLAAGNIISIVISSPSGTPNQAYVCAEVLHADLQ